MFQFGAAIMIHVILRVSSHVYVSRVTLWGTHILWFKLINILCCKCVDFPLSSHSKYLTSKQSIITCGQDKFGIDRPLHYSIMEEFFIQYPSLWYDHGHWPYFLAYEMFVYNLFHIIIIISDLDIIGAVIVVVILSLILPLMLYWSHRFVDNIYRQHHHHHFHHCYLHWCMFVSVTWYSNLTKTCLKMSHWTTPNDIVKTQHGWSRTWLL